MARTFRKRGVRFAHEGKERPFLLDLILRIISAFEWVGVDPTNGDDIGLRHVVVAKGRDHGDVAPLKGIDHGAPSRALVVTVEITRVA